MNRIFVCDELERLVKSLSSPVYVVGGYVRDSLLGESSTDIDLCGAFGFRQMRSQLLDGYKMVSLDKKTDTFNLIMPSGKAFSFAPFRIEEYSGGGHNPKTVIFTDSLIYDVKRRDFTCNAIYYNLKSHEFVDPTGGIEDIQNRILRVVDYDNTLSYDGARIYRLARFAGKLNLQIDAQSMKSARQNALKAKELTLARRNKEMDFILTMDEPAKTKALTILKKLDVL